jgi:F-type H+-transporting ATPase subunit delta
VTEYVDGYAAALLELARAEGLLGVVVDELYAIGHAFEGSAELRRTLSDIRIPLERKRGVIGELVSGKASALTAALVDLIVATGRAMDLSAIADRLAESAAAEENRVVAEVRCAQSLDSATVARLEESLSSVTGKDVEVKTVVDLSVIGGLVARVGDIVIDGSLRHRFDQLRHSIGGGGG